VPAVKVKVLRPSQFTTDIVTPSAHRPTDHYERPSTYAQMFSPEYIQKLIDARHASKMPREYVTDEYKQAI